jgi:hypothetical protein
MEASPSGSAGSLVEQSLRPLATEIDVTQKMLATARLSDISNKVYVKPTIEKQGPER